MVLAGDEFARTQKGNNNAYCQDNDISWVDWSLAEKSALLVEFFRKLTSIRHKYPILRRNLFLNGEYIDELEVRDVTWINCNGNQMEKKDWDDPATRCFGVLLDGRAQTTGIRQRGKEATLLIAINGYHDAVEFTLTNCAGDGQWSLLFDTNIPEPEERSSFKIGDRYMVTARSLLLFVFEASQ
jgi:glycogen operon protein